jgi:hypothetical protein
MVALIFLFLNLVASPFKSKSRLEAENAALRQQLIVLQRKVRGRVQFTNSDRLFFIQLYRWCPSVLNAMIIIRPETLVRWHRAGFRRYWRWQSHCAGGRPQIHAELRALIWRMSLDNRLWGAPHIHGELLKLGFAVAQSTVAKYMAKKGDPSGQSWGTFLHNHAPHIAAMDLFVVPTIGFVQLYVLVIVRLARRELVWINVTAHPTAEWIAQQLTEAFPWNEVPRYLIMQSPTNPAAPAQRTVPPCRTGGPPAFLQTAETSTSSALQAKLSASASKPRRAAIAAGPGDPAGPPKCRFPLQSTALLGFQPLKSPTRFHEDPENLWKHLFF